MTDRTILHYTILKKLGEGGMGVVYLAYDTKLERKVAIKFLPSQESITQDDRERFKTEARAAAALNHPNIAHIYAIEETDDELFIVMEYVEGQDLREMIEARQGKPLPIDDVIRYAEQISAGLEAAHNKGVIHRDIKSSNIMITNDNRVKIMDFGLAKIIGGTPVTMIGATVGTAAYISPEQIYGNTIDNRTDIWSFGVVMYEILTGQLPFTGTYDQAIMYLILNESPTPPIEIKPELPAVLEILILTCLQKEPDYRFRDFGEILSLLKNPETDNDSKKISLVIMRRFFRKKPVWITTAVFIAVLFAIVFWKMILPSVVNITGANSLPLIRIAVLPFHNIQDDPETNFLGFALADQIIGSLTYVQNILVRPSSSIRQFGIESITPTTAGNQLKVDYVLDGSYLKNADRIRLKLELVNVHSNEIVWRNDFDAKYENTFELQDIVSRKVLNGLKLKFSPAASIKQTDISVDPVAYEYFLRAVSSSTTNKDNILAIRLLLQTVQIDSNFAPAYAELGYRYHTLAIYDPAERDKLQKAVEAYQKAIAIDDQSISALVNLASLYTEIGRSTDGIQLIEKSLKINPNNAESHFWLGYIYRYTGQLDKATREMESAINLDPSNPRFRSIGITYLYQQRFEDAISGFRLDKGSPYSTAFIGQVYLRMGKTDSARIFLRKVMQLEPHGTLGIWSGVMLDFLDNRKEDGLKALRNLEMSDVYDAEQIYNYANLYGLYGAPKDCARLLKKAVDKGFYCYPYVQKDSFFDPVRNDKEFQEALAYAGKKYEAFKQSLAEQSD